MNPQNDTVPCWYCKGTGLRLRESSIRIPLGGRDADVAVKTFIDCASCEGTGRIKDEN